MNYEIVDARTVPAPTRTRNNPLLKLVPGQAFVQLVDSATEQQALQNTLSAKARTAKRHTSYSYSTTKYSDEEGYKVAVICSED